MDLQKINQLNFINLLNKLPAQDYFLSVIAYGAAPTLREEKPSSLMTFTKSNRNLYELWNKFKTDVCNELELEFVQLGHKPHSVRVLFYKRRPLEDCINRKDSREYLHGLGYEPYFELEECIDRLKQRFNHICPHEIGIFLGIPVEDVVGFIRHKGENSLICRYWKVYHEPEKARSLFESFDRAREEIRASISNSYEVYL